MGRGVTTDDGPASYTGWTDFECNHNCVAHLRPYNVKGRLSHPTQRLQINYQVAKWPTSRQCCFYQWQETYNFWSTVLISTLCGSVDPRTFLLTLLLTCTISDYQQTIDIPEFKPRTKYRLTTCVIYLKNTTGQQCINNKFLVFFFFKSNFPGHLLLFTIFCIHMFSYIIQINCCFSLLVDYQRL